MAKANRNYLTWSHSILSCVLLVIVVILLNVVMAGAGVRVDLTEEGLFTLDEGSKRILGRLRDPVSLTVFWGNVPKQSESSRRFIEGLLEEMQEVAGDKLSVRWVDTDEEDGEQEAEASNITQFRFPRIEGNKRVETIGYMTLLLESGADEPQKFDAIGPRSAQLESLLLTEIDKRSRLSPPTLAVAILDSPLFMHNDVTGSGRGGRFNLLKDLLKQSHGKRLQELETLDEPIAADVDVLLVVAPFKLPEPAVYNVEQFALRGGRVILMLDPVNAENTIIQGQEREPRTSGLEDWLAHLGVTIEYGLVGDFNADNQCINLFNRKERGPYAYWPLVTQDNMDTSNVVMQLIRAMPTVFPSAITVDDARQTEAGRTVQVLARTSAFGHRRAEIGAVADKLTYPLPPTNELESIPLVVMIEGPLTSKWEGKDRPKTAAELAAAAQKKAEEDAAKQAEQDAKDAAEAGGGDAKDEAAGSPDGDESPVPAPGEAPGKDEAPGEDDAPAPAPKEDKPPAPAPEPEKPGGNGGEGDDGDEAPPAEDEKQADEEQGPPRLNKGEVRILIVSDAEMCADYMGPQVDRRFGVQVAPPNGEGGFAFAVGMAEWLSGGEDLIGLRARNTNPRQLENLEASEQKTIQLVNLAAIPFLLLCIGFVVFVVRRSQRS